jgi:putative endonuclease
MRRSMKMVRRRSGIASGTRDRPGDPVSALHRCALQRARDDGCGSEGLVFHVKFWRDSSVSNKGMPPGMRPAPGALRKQFAVYILANRPRGVLYVGLTSSLTERIWQHREGVIQAFTSRYAVTRLVYFEWSMSAEEAIAREKQLKRWQRAWKIELIESFNSTWRDLWPDIAVL